MSFSPGLSEFSLVSAVAPRRAGARSRTEGRPLDAPHADRARRRLPRRLRRAVAAAPASTARGLDGGAARRRPPRRRPRTTSTRRGERLARPGTSAATAWKSLAKVTAATFAPGTQGAAAPGAARSARASRWPSRAGPARRSPSRRTGREPDRSSPAAAPGAPASCCPAPTSSWTASPRTGAATAASASAATTTRSGTRRVSGHATGIYVKAGSDYGTYTANTLVDNNIENVNTPSPGGDDSGAFGFLIHGDHNLFSRNTVQGSIARSYDWVWDGGAFEIYDGDYNTITRNLAIDNNNFSELGHSKKQSSVDRERVHPQQDSRDVCQLHRGSRPHRAWRQGEVRTGQRDGVLRQHGAADRPDGAWRDLPRRVQQPDPDDEEQRDHRQRPHGAMPSGATRRSCRPATC